MAGYSNDWISMANAAQPRMMPQVPLGGGFGAGLMYGQDQLRQDQFLQRAAGSAMMDDQMQQMKLDEAQAGHQGRMDTAETGNIVAQQEKEMAKQGMITKIAEQTAKLDKAKKQSLESKANIFAQVAKANPEDVPAILDYYGDEAIWNGKDLRKVDPEMALMISKGIIQGLKESNPAYQKAIDQQNMKNEGFRTAATIKAASNERIAMLKARTAQAIASLQAKTKTELHNPNNIKNIEGYITNILTDPDNEDIPLEQRIEMVTPLKDMLKDIRKGADQAPANPFGPRPGQAKPTAPTKKPDPLGIR